MELILALVALLAGAVMALRSAAGTHERPPGQSDPAPEEVRTAAIPPYGLAPQHPNGEVAELAPEDPGQVAATAIPERDPEAPPEAKAQPQTPPAIAITAEFPLALPPGPTPLRLPAAATAVPGPVTVAERTKPAAVTITEDLRLEDVLTAAAEPAEAPRHPALRLAGAIAALGISFAAAILLSARGIQELFGRLFGR